MESFRTADGRTLAYRREGAGPVLICHPGGPGFSSRYFGDLAGLGESFTLILLDPRGTGGSDHPADARAYDTEDYVGDVEELRAHLELERMPLLGHSHGGVVAAAYAAAHPDRVEKLVLASTVARFAEEQEAAMVRMMETRSAEPWYAERARGDRPRAGGVTSPAREELQELVKREMPFTSRTTATRRPAMSSGSARRKPNPDALQLFNTETWPVFDLRPGLSSITAPTLVITGELDFITGPACAADFAAIPGQRTVLVADCGHFILREARDRFRDEVIPFLGA